MATQNEQRLDLYLAAEAKLLGGGQSVRLGDRQVNRGDLAEIRAEIARLQRVVASERNAATGGARFATADLGGEW